MAVGAVVETKGHNLCVLRSKALNDCQTNQQLGDLIECFHWLFYAFHLPIYNHLDDLTHYLFHDFSLEHGAVSSGMQCYGNVMQHFLVLCRQINFSAQGE